MKFNGDSRMPLCISQIIQRLIKSAVRLSPGEIYIYIQIDLLSVLYIKKHDFVRINFKLLVWHYILCLLLTNCASIG